MGDITDNAINIIGTNCSECKNKDCSECDIALLKDRLFD